MDAEDQGYPASLALPERPKDKVGTPLEENASTSGSPSLRERSQMNIKDRISRKPFVSLGSSTTSAFSAMTPTSNLAGQLDSISLRKSGSIADNVRGSSLDSPTSDYASGNFSSGNFPSANFPSLSESDQGYSSLSSGNFLKVGPAYGNQQAGRVPITLQQPSSSEGTSIPRSKEDQKYVDDDEEESVGSDEMSEADIERDSACVNSEQLLSLQGIGTVARDESLVPGIAEDIEISTFSSSAPASLVVQQPKQDGFGATGVLSKRSRFDGDQQPASKNPRLSPESSAPKKAVRMSAVVPTTSSTADRLFPHVSYKKGQSPVMSGDHSPSPTPSPASVPAFTPISAPSVDPAQLEKLFLPGASLTLPVSSLAGAAATPDGFQKLIHQIMQQQLQAQQQQQQQLRKRRKPSPEGMASKSSHLQQSKAHVDFRSIQDMAKSDRPATLRNVSQGPSSMEVDPASSSSATAIRLTTSEMYQSQGSAADRLKPLGSPAPPASSTSTSSPLPARLTPDIHHAHHHGGEGRDRPARSTGSPLPPSSPMNIINLISPRGSRQASRSPIPSRSLSPHSPQMGKATPPESGTIVIGESRGESSGEDVRMRAQGEESEKKEEGLEVRSRGGEAPPSVLLQVSEAHLALYPDEDGDTPLHMAIIHENVRLARYLISVIKRVHTKNSNLDIPNNMRQTPLHLAIITKQAQMVQMLKEAGASVNYPDRKGNSAVHLAAVRKDVDMLKLLSKFSSPLPDFNAKNFAGLTPAHVATKEASIEVLKYLFQMGANKNASDTCSGRAPIHYAVEAENFILVNFLLENSCNVNAPTYSGNTPLHIAAGRRLKEIVALLMAYGANPALANGEGDFPSDLPASLLMQRAKLNAH